ncbi:MAG TPA: hypothetical protein VF614_06450 [Chthoniobacteraceae bacterium]
MRTTLLSLLILFSDVELSCGGSFLSPEGVVRAAIAATHQDRLSQFLRCCDIPAITAHPRHPMALDALAALMESLNEADVRFEPSSANHDSDRLTVRMFSPQRLDFDLVGTKQINGVQWRIVAIHP